MGQVLRMVDAPGRRAEAKGASPDGRPVEERSDEELMALVRLDSRVAFRVLVVRHAEKVAGFCARITGDRGGASEVAQEVWLAVWDGRARWEPRSRFASLLYTIAFTRARNHVRSRRRRAAVFSPEPLAHDVAMDTSAGEIDRLLERERSERVWSALGNLPEAMREALVLRFVEDLTYDEMESILEAKASTLRARVHHALGRLKEILGREAL